MSVTIVARCAVRLLLCRVRCRSPGRVSIESRCDTMFWDRLTQDAESHLCDLRRATNERHKNELVKISEEVRFDVKVNMKITFNKAAIDAVCRPDNHTPHPCVRTRCLRDSAYALSCSMAQFVAPREAAYESKAYERRPMNLDRIITLVLSCRGTFLGPFGSGDLGWS